ncbi:MAG: fluoride efflux transporter CrcB [Planctomycetota bacterium]|nr:MAG: fluoride efflux transporter CrcB [Planctomycetota bacterium]
MQTLLYIALGGAAGSIARWWLAGLAQRLSPAGAFPAGTLVVNVAGCLVIGLLGAFFASPSGLRVRDPHRLAVMVGLLGGFTTFSSYAYETLQLTDDGAWLRAGANILLSNALGLTAALLGYRLGQRLFGL